MKKLNLLAVMMIILSAKYSYADTQWQKNHPRRAQVNSRLNNQQKRVDNGLANGTLNTQQAQKIQNQDRRIRNTERRDAGANGGAVTQRQQQKLNQRENNVSQEISRDKAANSGAPAGTPVTAPSTNP